MKLVRGVMGLVCLGVAACAEQQSDIMEANAGQTQARLAPLPSPDITLSRIAFGSCADEEKPQPIWATIARENPDMFLFIGDNVYADHNRGKPVENFSRAELEFSYGLLQEHPDFAPFRARVPMLSTWDDHDFGKNDAGVEFALKSDAKELMLATLGAPQETAMVSRPGVYHAATYGAEGQRVQVIMLDTRWFRTALTQTDERGAPGKERYVPDGNPSNTMLGEAQWRWLAERLKEPADLRLLVSSIQVIADGHGWEAWRTMPIERERLFNLIETTGADNMVILSGDRHVGGLYRQEIAPGLVLQEITSSSLNLPWSNWNPGKDRVEETGPYQIGDLYGFENYGLLTINWRSRQLQADLRSSDGTPVRSTIVSF